MNTLTMPDLFRKTKADWLEGARVTAVRLLRKKHSITIEDVLEHYKFPKYLHHNTIGRVFQDERFQALDYVRSNRRVSHGRIIRRWTLNDHYQKRYEADCE